MKLLLSLLACLYLVGCRGQNKIGDLTVSDKLFNAYILDCYKPPDTINKRSSIDFGGCKNCSARQEDFDRWDREAKDFNDALIKSAIIEIIKTVYYPAYSDTLYTDGILMMSGWTDADYHSKKRKIEKILKEPAGSYINHTGRYLVPRKPSEIDFVKWLKNNPQ